MKKKIGLFIFIVFLVAFLFCGNKVFNPEAAPADMSSVLVNETPKQEEYKPARIIFVGDMMFDRGVERLMQQMSFLYPVELIKDFLQTFDFAVGNLEGPINEKTTAFADDSLKFSFDKKSLESLQAGNFSIVSLANNHTLNTGREGLLETEKILTENNIAYVGDPVECDMDYIYQKDGITYYAVNITFPDNCSNKQVAKQIEDIKFYNPETFLAVLIHWGTEYKTVSSAGQQTLAHLMVDSGADLIIGGHPHVVQNIEKYNNKLIFYSLGNFVFDQYFSKETQEGLAVGMEIYPEKKVYSLYPVVNKSSQTRLMEDAEKTEFLNNLSENSSEELKESIKNGVIEIK